LTGVIVKSGEPFEKALKRWSKSCEKAGKISDVKKSPRFEKPSEEKKRKKTAAKRKLIKEAMEPMHASRRGSRSSSRGGPNSRNGRDNRGGSSPRGESSSRY
jgi:small subunit ribosomal protein S21